MCATIKALTRTYLGLLEIDISSGALDSAVSLFGGADIGVIGCGIPGCMDGTIPDIMLSIAPLGAI